MQFDEQAELYNSKSLDGFQGRGGLWCGIQSIAPYLQSDFHSSLSADKSAAQVYTLSRVPSQPNIIDAQTSSKSGMQQSYARKLGMSYDNNLEGEFRISGFIISATPVDALGDAGSNRNTMDEAYVRKPGYKIDGGAASTVRVGQKTVKTVGVVHLPFRFRDETTSYSIRFHVISNCPQDVILGYPFLKATKTLPNTMNFARRVFDRTVMHMSRYRDMLYIGNIGPKFTGTIGGRPYEALADTGSKVLIIDEDFARSRRLPIIDAEEYRIKLRFADSSTARTSGMTQGVIWQFGLANEEKSFPLDFFILKDAPSDVILSENF
jgi:hypothetical protein